MSDKLTEDKFAAKDVPPEVNQNISVLYDATGNGAMQIDVESRATLYFYYEIGSGAVKVRDINGQQDLEPNTPYKFPGPRTQGLQWKIGSGGASVKFGWGRGQ